MKQLLVDSTSTPAHPEALSNWLKFGLKRVDDSQITNDKNI